jgi:hypothetical protein
MTFPPMTAERAFDLARSGQYRTIEEIRRKLKAEGFCTVDENFRSASLIDQLGDILRARADSA